MSHITSRKRLVQHLDIKPKIAPVHPLTPSPVDLAQEKLSWVEKHGSRYLKRIIAAGYKSDKVYDTERFAWEVEEIEKGFKKSPLVFSHCEIEEFTLSPLDPPYTALALLHVVLRHAPDAELALHTATGKWVVLDYYYKQMRFPKPRALVVNRLV